MHEGLEHEFQKCEGTRDKYEYNNAKKEDVQ
jgi:hypothetical protein